MLGIVALATAAAATPPNPVSSAVGGLSGCWKVPGQVRGKDSTSIARGEWHLGRRYFMLHLKAVAGKPYEAAIAYGAGEKPGEVGSFWMDTFGGMYQPSLGLGRVTAEGFTLDYRFPDAVYTNRFVRVGRGWTWTIIEKATGKSERVFAEYRFNRASCSGMKFDF
jgi:hypothetical protein